MATMTEKAELTVTAELGDVGEDDRADLLNRLAKLYRQPGQKLTLVLSYGCVEDLIEAKAEISRALRHRAADIKVTYKTSVKDLDIQDAGDDDAARPMERALEAIGAGAVEFSINGRKVGAA